MAVQATLDTWVELQNDLTVWLLQARLIELNLPIKAELGALSQQGLSVAEGCPFLWIRAKQMIQNWAMSRRPAFRGQRCLTLLGLMFNGIDVGDGWRR